MRVKLPYPVKILGIRFQITRTIGFEFNNLALFNFRENTGLKDSKLLQEWVKKHGQPAMINEIIYGAAQAYCMINKIRENFDRKKLLQAVTLAPEETQKRIIAAWELSVDQGKNKEDDSGVKKKNTKQ